MRVRWTVPAAEDPTNNKNYLQQHYPHFAEPTVRTNLSTHPFAENLTEHRQARSPHRDKRPPG